MSEAEILFEVKDGLGLITLNRPEALNAWNGGLNRGLHDALVWATEDDAVGAVVITGAGRAFCAGADLSTGADTFAAGAERDVEDDDQRGESDEHPDLVGPAEALELLQRNPLCVGVLQDFVVDLPRVSVRHRSLPRAGAPACQVGDRWAIHDWDVVR